MVAWRRRGTAPPLGPSTAPAESPLLLTSGHAGWAPPTLRRTRQPSDVHRDPLRLPNETLVAPIAVDLPVLHLDRHDAPRSDTDKVQLVRQPIWQPSDPTVENGRAAAFPRLKRSHLRRSSFETAPVAVCIRTCRIVKPHLSRVETSAVASSSGRGNDAWRAGATRRGGPGLRCVEGLANENLTLRRASRGGTVFGLAALRPPAQNGRACWRWQPHRSAFDRALVGGRARRERIMVQPRPGLVRHS